MTFSRDSKEERLCSTGAGPFRAVDVCIHLAGSLENTSVVRVRTVCKSCVILFLACMLSLSMKMLCGIQFLWTKWKGHRCQIWLRSMAILDTEALQRDCVGGGVEAAVPMTWGSSPHLLARRTCERCLYRGELQAWATGLSRSAGLKLLCSTGNGCLPLFAFTQC